MTRSAYIVTLARGIGLGDNAGLGLAAETLILVPAETRSEAHRKALLEIQKRQDWPNPRIIESLRLPGQPRDAAEQFAAIAANHLRETRAAESDKE